MSLVRAHLADGSCLEGETTAVAAALRRERLDEAAVSTSSWTAEVAIAVGQAGAISAVECARCSTRFERSAQRQHVVFVLERESPGARDVELRCPRGHTLASLRLSPR